MGPTRLDELIRTGGAARSRSRPSFARAVSVGLGVALFLVSCTAGEPARKPHGSVTPLPEGRILGSLDVAQGNPGVAEYLLPSGRTRPFDVPDRAFPIDAFWADRPGVAYGLFGTEHGIALYRLTLDGPPHRLGSLLKCVETLGHAGALVLASPCDPRSQSAPIPGSFGRSDNLVRVMDLTAPSAGWRVVAEGGPAALSPDGRRVAYSPDGRTVWTKPLDGSGEPEKVVDLATLRSVGSGDLKQPRIPYSLVSEGVFSIVPVGMAWGRGGLAFPILGQADRAIGVWSEGTELRVIPLHGADLSQLSWQPRGRILAYSTKNQGEAAVRLFDPSSDETSVVSLQPLRGFSPGFLGLAWSPDGRSLSSMRAGGSTIRSVGATLWQFLSQDGSQLAALPVQRLAFPYDWAA